MNQTMICANCNSTHNFFYGSGRFCSEKCARSFSTLKHRKLRNKKISDSLTGRKLTPEHIANNIAARNKIKYIRVINKLNELLKNDFNELTANQQRLIVLHRQDYKCANCLLDKWNGQTITFELDHIDGNRNNNNETNLRFLCPNCHSLTSTWRGRNKNKLLKNQVSDEELLAALISSKSIRQALISVNLSPKGNNYFRARALLIKHNIDK